MALRKKIIKLGSIFIAVCLYMQKSLNKKCYWLISKRLFVKRNWGLQTSSIIILGSKPDVSYFELIVVYLICFFFYEKQILNLDTTGFRAVFLPK